MIALLLFIGRLVIQTRPDLHRELVKEAVKRHLSVDAYVEDVLEKAVGA